MRSPPTPGFRTDRTTDDAVRRTHPRSTVEHMPNLALELDKQTASLGVTSVYGQQQDVGGVTLVPVALACTGFGAGEAAEGSGGGGGGYAIPLGAYIRKGDDLRFEPNLVSLAAIAIPLVWVVGRALSRIIRALKR